jgi:CheY-like chemotaxis protein
MSRLLDLGARRTARRRLDLREPVREALELVRISLPPGVALLSDVADVALCVEADPTDVLQVMLNLAINARDALGDMAGEIRITAGPASPEDLAGPMRLGAIRAGVDYHRLTVGDNGMGMDADEAAEIFKPYYSTKGERGTGLGLSVVAGILGDNMAALALSTGLGAGARFSVFWPTSSGCETRPVTLEGVTAIVAEDDPGTLAMLTSALDGAGAEVAACEDPADALEALSEDPAAWHLLVTDFDMPRMTGAMLAAAARSRAPGLAVVLCTGMAEGDPRLAPHRPLFDAILRKPLTGHSLVGAVAQVLQRGGDPNDPANEKKDKP